MLTQVVGWTGNALLTVLVVRSLSGRLFTKYPVFYLYLSWVFLVSYVAFYFYVFRPDAYASFYWVTEFFSLALGYFVLWEICKQVLANSPRVSQMAQTLLLAVFVVVVANVVIATLSDPRLSSAQIPVVLERNLRAVQAMLLVTVVGLLVYYNIPMGRNIKGMISGYGLFVGASLAHLTLGSHLGERFQPWWQYLQPAAFDLALVIWTATLWSYAPNPKPTVAIELEEDYQEMSAQVERALSQARNYLLRGVRP